MKRRVLYIPTLEQIKAGAAVERAKHYAVKRKVDEATSYAHSPAGCLTKMAKVFPARSSIGED